MSTVTAKTEYSVKFENLDGGLNISDLDFRLSSNESPEMKNLRYLDGTLCSRYGQIYSDAVSLGTCHACYSRQWHGAIFAHIGTRIYVFRENSGTWSHSYLYAGISQTKGTFFMYDGYLYYKTTGAYVKITAVEVNGTWSFTAASVTGYIPVILINADPHTASGDLYQPENRISSSKTVWYNASAGVHDYHLPVRATSVTKVVVDGVETTSYVYNTMTGIVTFYTAPPVTDPATNNTVRITYVLDNSEAMQSISDCRFVEVFGGTGSLCIVMAGSSAQPNAYFWNGNTSVSMDASYFPIEQYQLAGDTSESVTGFGKQQNYLVIFKECSVGRSQMSTEDIDGRTYIDLPYTNINARTGCDLPWSIQLIENNLVWANTKTGIHMLRDSSSALENNIVGISHKINGSSATSGLLEDLKAVNSDVVCSMDDDENYWICANNHVWLWNYSISKYSEPSWFYYTSISAGGFIHESENTWHIDLNGRLVHFEDVYSDFGAAIEKVFRFATQKLGSYDRLKNINSVIIAMRNDADNYALLSYGAESDLRQDLTPLDCSAAATPNDFAAVFRRRPGCKRVKHFSMKLENSIAGKDLSIISAEVLFNYQGRLR